MTFLPRIFAMLLLLTVALLTVARRADSGWIAFETLDRASDGILLMTGDGSAQTQPANSDAILRRSGQLSLQEKDLLQVIRDEAGEAIIIGGVHLLSLDAPLQYIREPIWSPDGAWIAFLSGEPAGKHVYRVRADGRQLERLTRRASDLVDLHWSPDGEWLLVVRVHQRFADIVRVRADGSDLEILTPGLYPQYAPASGLRWHPMLMILAALGMLILSMVGRLRR